VRLTSLEIKGFKSFPDPTAIYFNNAITGVVGPNGCGKSNIVDAIRWVLGEQKTAMLRSEKMGGLIFNGTKQRKQAGLAEVSLNLDNSQNTIDSEFTTVKITRRLYRNGDSEYRLNDVPCRLKDITNLFIDTGIGSDSYAIMELGMIDDILKDQDNSRRRLFEQAAGISIYKTRKKETLNKLKATEDDLNRVEDLLQEINENLSSLDKQAKRTKRYYKLRDEYKELSLEQARCQLAGFNESYKDVEEKIQTESKTREQYEQQIQKLEQYLEQERKAILEEEKKVSSTQKELNETTTELQNKENEKNLTNEQIKFLKEKKQTLAQQTDQANKEIETIEQELTRLRKEREKLQQQVEEAEQALNASAKEAKQVREQHNAAKQTLEQKTQEQQKITAKRNELEKQKAVNNSQIEGFRQEIEQNTQDRSTYDERLATLDQELKEVEEEKQQKEQERAELEKEEQKLNETIEQVRRKLEEIRSQKEETNRKLDAKKHEHGLLKSLVDNLEGFPESIKYLKKNAEWAKQAPLLSDIIYTPEAYRAAIESYLAPWLNYYILPSYQDAVKSINLLSEAGKGRAHFFILDEFDHYTPGVPEIVQHATPATEIIEVDEKYHCLAAYLLDNVYLLPDKEHLESALQELANKEHLTLMTQNGQFIKSAYALAGGSSGLFQGKRLGRAKNLEKLKKEINQLEKDLTTIDKQRQGQEEELQSYRQASQQKKIDQVRQAITDIGQRIVSIKTQKENLANTIEQADNKKATLEEQMKEAQAKNDKLDEELQQLTEQEGKLNQEVQEAEDHFNQIAATLNESSDKQNQQNIDYHKLNNELDSTTKEIDYKSARLEEFKKSIEEDKQKMQEAEQEQSNNNEKITSIEKALQELTAKKEKLQNQLQADEKRYYNKRGEVNEAEEKLGNLNKKKQQVEELLARYKERMNQLKLDLNSLKERLSVEFDADINQLINEEPSGQYTEEELGEKVAKKKQQLDNFGEINPMAVQAHDEMKQRHDFISGQKQDLLDAKESLQQTMQEIEDTAEQKFRGAFAQVRENFINVFRKLFSEEDDCDLQLEDDNNPLDSRIEIIAKPKGKKPQTINQLSGGEKAMTSLALLFALYLLKPAPFCVLDEVDAPLDDTNISKFNQMIREFGQDSQFILVTHNKQTMASVDVIYGVTMAQQGISTVVPVDFRELEEQRA